jgi:hypothetical protein
MMEDWSTVDFQPHPDRDKIGNWFTPINFEKGAFTLDTGGIIQDLMAKMNSIEENFMTEAVIEILRMKGYTVIKPGGEPDADH